MGVILQTISIIIESFIAIFGVLIAVQKKKIYGWGIALTFAVYVFYDLVGTIGLNIQENFLQGIFFIATISIAWVVFSLYKEGKRK